jgi:hypothetical protein
MKLVILPATLISYVVFVILIFHSSTSMSFPIVDIACVLVSGI